MAGRATGIVVTLAALSLAIVAARAQNSEYDALPEPAVAAPPPAPAVTQKPTAAHPLQTKGAAEKEPAAQKKQGAALGTKQDSKEKEEDLPVRHMAPSAAIPPWPGDERGPKTIEFLGSCAKDFDSCMQTVRDVGEKLPDSELCIPSEVYFNTVTDRVRKWATLRPDIHGQPAGRVIAAALRSIYPCKRGTPVRAAAEKGAPKGAKAAQ